MAGMTCARANNDEKGEYNNGPIFYSFRENDTKQELVFRYTVWDHRGCAHQARGMTCSHLDQPDIDGYLLRLMRMFGDCCVTLLGVIPGSRPERCVLSLAVFQLIMCTAYVCTVFHGCGTVDTSHHTLLDIRTTREGGGSPGMDGAGSIYKRAKVASISTSDKSWSRHLL